jgi:hypothetical protein
MLTLMSLSDDVVRIGTAAEAYAAPGESVTAVLAVEAGGERLYLCAFTGAHGAQTWLVLDAAGSPVTSRDRVRDAASIAALVEVAEEGAEMDGVEPRVASLDRLDAMGASAVSAIQTALPAIDELAKDIESNYKVELS